MIKDECKQVINDEFFEIYECEEDSVCKIKTNKLECEIETFKCSNEDKKDILFVAVDNCQFGSSDDFKKCDFILVDENEIVFVELKINTKPKNRKKKRSEAIEQLKSSIDRFHYLIGDKKIYSYICFGKEFKVPHSSLQTKAIEFQEETNSILKIECIKEFKRLVKC